MGVTVVPTIPEMLAAAEAVHRAVVSVIGGRALEKLRPALKRVQEKMMIAMEL